MAIKNLVFYPKVYALRNVMDRIIYDCYNPYEDSSWLKFKEKFDEDN
jgi:hypothetical protein